MSRRPVPVSDELHDYLIAHGTPPDEIAQDLMDETATKLPDEAGMQVAPDQGAFLTILTRLLNVRLAVEIGTFTGYSALSIARGMSDGGKLICCDVNDEWTSIGRRYWERAGVADRIEVRLGDARDTLRAMPEEATIDLTFIDADKVGYLTYWELLVPRMRPGGVLLVDNVFQHGQVIEPAVISANVRAIREFNGRVIADDRVDVVMLPIADGLTLARRR